MKSYTKFIFLFYLTLILPLFNNSANAQNNGFVAMEDSVKVLIESDKVDTILPEAYTIKKSHAEQSKTCR